MAAAIVLTQVRSQLRDIYYSISIMPVLFPGVIIPITIGRDKSVKLIKDADSGNGVIDNGELFGLATLTGVDNDNIGATNFSFGPI